MEGNKEEGRKTVITINGINFSTEEAFAEYRAKHEFRIGDAVMGLFMSYGNEGTVKPAFVTGINDFGDGRHTIDIAYIDYNDFKFASIMSDEIVGDKKPTTGLVGLAPLNRWNNVGLKCATVLEALEGTIAAKRLELDQLLHKEKMIREFMEGLKEKAAAGGDAK